MIIFERLTSFLWGISHNQCNCGKKIIPNSRIVSGTETGVNEFPWHVGLLFPNDEYYDGKTTSCGGSIISNKHILTAAHCVFDISKKTSVKLTISDILVVLGEHDVTDSLRVVMELSNITEHPNYKTHEEGKEINNYYDIAILTLKTPFLRPAPQFAFQQARQRIMREEGQQWLGGVTPGLKIMLPSLIHFRRWMSRCYLTLTENVLIVLTVEILFMSKSQNLNLR